MMEPLTNPNQTGDEWPVRIRLEHDQIIAAPGEELTFSVYIINQSTSPITVEVSLRGLPSEWMRASTEMIQVGPEDVHEVRFPVRPPLGIDSAHLRYPVSVLARDPVHPRRMISADLTLTVVLGPDSEQSTQAVTRIDPLQNPPQSNPPDQVDLRLAAAQFSVNPGAAVEVPLVVANRTTHEEQLQLNVEGIPGGWVTAQASVFRLLPGEERESGLVIQPPRDSEGRAGRHIFQVTLTSLVSQGLAVTAEAALQVGAFSDFTVDIDPIRFEPGQPGQVTIRNLGNLAQNHTVLLDSPGNDLVFEIHQPVRDPNNMAAEPLLEWLHYNPALPPVLHLPPGATGILEFSPQTDRRPLFGDRRGTRFTATVRAGDQVKVTAAEVNQPGLLPVWILPIAALLCIMGALFAWIFVFGTEMRAPNEATQTAQTQLTLIQDATQTASANMTQAATAGLVDTDGDRLTDSQEATLGTNPNAADTDSDGLGDGDELQRTTNPLNRDTDSDGLQDGDEVIRGTNPLQPDTDGDGLLDGDEVQRQSDPLKADTDEDGLNDYQEVQAGTNPTRPDTDGDGLIDSRDPNPTDANNPSITQTAAASVPTATLTLPPPTETPAPTPQAPPPPSFSGIIAFQSNRNGQEEIYVQTSGDEPALRGDDLASSTTPALSPDGTRLAFTTNQDGNLEVYIVNIDGSSLTNLTNHPANDSDPAWAPDGQSLVFTTDRDGNQEIYLATGMGGGEISITNLTNNPAQDRQPAWIRVNINPLQQANRVLFATDRDGNDEVYAMEPDGSNPTNLSNNPASDSLPAGSNQSQIAFTSNRDGNQEIYTMDANGAGQVNRSGNPSNDTAPAWSPDGNRIAFTTDRDGNMEIYLTNADGSDPVNLSNHSAQDSNPSWR